MAARRSSLTPQNVSASGMAEKIKDSERTFMEPALIECRWVRERRERLDLTQEQCAAVVGVTRVTWNAWELGDSCPGQRRIVRLSELLQMPVQECIEQVSAWRAVASKLR